MWHFSIILCVSDEFTSYINHIVIAILQHLVEKYDILFQTLLLLFENHSSKNYNSLEKFSNKSLHAEIMN